MNERLHLREQFRLGLIDKHEYSRRITATHDVLREYSELLANSDIRSLEIDADGVWMHSRLEPIAFACDLGDRGTPPMVSLHFGRYEGVEFDMWRRLVRPGMTVADVGANIGWYAAHTAAADSTARVFAFEPVPDSCALLRRTVARNALTNVVVECLAVSDRSGTMTISVDPTIAGAASAHPTVYVDGADTIQVDSVTLDAYAARRDIRFDAIKVDIEGGELAALRGAADILARDRPFVFSEMLRRHARAFGYHPNDLIAFMESLGYTCFKIHGEHLAHFATMDEDTIETNFFFLHRASHASAIAVLAQ